MHFGAPDPLYSNYPGNSPWSHTAANPLNAVDADGMEWRLVKDDDGKPFGYEWVEGKDAYDEKGNLLPGVYKNAIFFTATGKNGEKFDAGNGGKNMGTSIAIVYGDKKDDIIEYKACTNPTDPDKYATVPAGEYEAMVGLHKGDYPALRLSDIGTTDFSNNKIELGMPNPSAIDKTYAQGINIHKAGTDNFTGKMRNDKPISAGCLLIDRGNWNSFMSNFKSGVLIGVTIQR